MMHTEWGRYAMIYAMNAVFHTSAGDIAVELFPEDAPETVANFTELAQGTRTWTNPRTGEESTDPLYNGTIFHRVISGFMIQGGDPLGNGTGGPGYTFDDEISPNRTFEQPYVLAMANAGTRMGRGTNGSQFFITVAPTPWLQGKHTIFGQVTDAASQAVVDQIAEVATGNNDRPLQDVVIESVEIVNE
ncbi:peptidyl-prolyl cis-trans isomerase A (cyclophilin A) [Actinobaculum suis]|uniref:Peptidyl-prolyl cis-trans isomerase n=2 Tax=Actinobaculum suis TaxID=1657 RepID=A0A1G7A7B0_9ACTO|nr:peptidyl-prolyl cis-trans isomerase A (cyclophilin A) [Actinobaculum suis]